MSLVLAACGSGEQEAASGAARGVTDDSITIGSHTDLSGGLAIWGVPLSNGQRMRYEEANAAGGVHGRRIEMIVEDTQYQMPLAIKATNKLLNVDDIFLMVGSMGTPMNIALMPRMFEASIVIYTGSQLFFVKAAEIFFAVDVNGLIVHVAW